MTKDARPGTLGPQPRTALALGLVIGLILGVVGTVAGTLLVLRSPEPGGSDATLDARAACELLERTPSLNRLGLDESQRLMAASLAARAAKEGDPDYTRLGDVLGEAGERAVMMVDLSAENQRRLARARRLCDSGP